MTRTTCFSTLSCAALLVALGAYGCGSSSTINPGTGGTAGRATSLGGGTGSLGGGGGTGSLGGAPGGTDAGVVTCVANAMCAAGFTCDQACMAGNSAGTRTCSCGANGRLTCPNGAASCDIVDAAPPPPPMDAGFNACTNNTPCTAGFTCDMTCMVGNNPPGIRACTCANNGRLNCPAGNNGCQFDAGPQPDAGFNACTVNTPCTAGFTCGLACNVQGNPGSRACTCNAQGRVACAGNNACMVFDAGAPPVDAARPPADGAADAPRG
jgi:hypothetical protein